MDGFLTGWRAEEDEDVSIGSDREEDEEETMKVDVLPEDETDNVCSLCHDGGELISCDGPCRRSFHPTLESGPEEGECPSLGLSQEELEVLAASEDTKFFCRNCQLGVQQCFKCKELGSAGREVFACQEKKCGKSYHVRCLVPKKEPPFTCPMHRCHSKACKKRSSGTGDGRFVVCRLCPRAWHEECVPRYVSFLENGDTPQRGWKLMHEESGEEMAAFIFCSEHDYELNRRGKPSYKSQNMVLFPGETAKSRGISPRFVKAAREWECPGCSKKGGLNLVLQESRVFATCRFCETGYWVNPNTYDRDGRFVKYGGKFAIVSRPKQKK